MKRVLTLGLALLLCLILTAPALADMIFEPMDDFYSAHASECVYENRVYITSGEGGSVLVYRSPVEEAVAELPNGEEHWISWIWPEDGGWGFLSFTDEGGSYRDAWVPLRDMTVKYDAISFAGEYGAEFYSPSEEDVLSLEGLKRLVLWEYPGSEDYSVWQLEGDDPMVYGSGELSFYTLYDDPQGRTWGEVGYFYGHRDVWFCLNDPAAEWLDEPAEEPGPDPAEPTETPDRAETEPPAAPTPAPTPIPAPETTPAAEGRRFPWLPAALVAAVVILAAVLLTLFRKKKR